MHGVHPRAAAERGEEDHMGPDRQPRRHRGPIALLAVLAALTVVAAACVAPPPRPGSALDGIPFDPPARSPEPSAACTTAATPPVGRQVWIFEQDGEHRPAFVDAPSAPAGAPLPVILSLHPFAVTAEAWDTYSDMAAEGTAAGYVVVTPQGSTDLGPPRWAVNGGLPGSDDPALIDQVIDRLGAEVCIDRSRIYATGFSAGSAFAASLTCLRPGLLAGIAGSGGTNLALPCPDGEPVDALIMHGELDTIAPLTGQTFLPPQNIPVQSVVDSYAQRGGCTGTVTDQVGPNTSLVRSTGCVPGGATAYLRLGAHGHNWAGREGLLLVGFITGPTSFEVDATATAIDWFDRT
jgi:polyhydroxybutyrate depolymerase